jgi:hypothetical protein
LCFLGTVSGLRARRKEMGTMSTPKTAGTRTALALLSVVVVAGAALALAACGEMKPSSGPSGSWMPGASPIPAITYRPQASTNTGNWPGTEGWYFKPTVDIEVTALGWYDDAQDGLTQVHRVGIFDVSDEQLLVESKVQPDSPLDGGFRWVPLEPPLVLEAGREYVMAGFAHAPFDLSVRNPKGATVAPELRYLRMRTTPESNPHWGFPDRKDAATCLNTNFKFRPLSVASPTP